MNTLAASLLLLLLLPVPGRAGNSRLDGAIAEEGRSHGLPPVLHRELPHYPPAEVPRRTAGCAVIGFDVTPEGVADGFQVLNSVPAGTFDATALQALKQWRFQPAAGTRHAVQAFRFGYSREATGTRIAGPPPKDCDLPIVELASVAARDAGVVVTRTTLPYYPPEAVRERMEGCAAIAFDLSTGGLPLNVEAITNSDGGFERAMAWAVQRWQFQKPAATTRVALVARFGLDGPASKAPPKCAGVAGYAAAVQGAP